MKYNIQQRICDCQLRIGGCYCELNEYNKEKNDTTKETLTQINK